MKINVNNKEQIVDEGINCLELSKKIYPEENIVAAIVNDCYYNLFKEIKENDKVKLFHCQAPESVDIMERTLTLVFILACKKLYPNKKIRVEHSIGDHLYCEWEDRDPFFHTDIEIISDKMKEIIKSDYPIERKKGSKEEVLKLFEEAGYTEKVNLFKELEVEDIDYYLVDGRIFKFFGYLAPSTGSLLNFDIKPYYPGVVITTSTAGTKGQIREFKEQKLLSKVFLASNRWTKLLNIRDVGELNQYIINGKSKFIIDIAEAYFENQISQVADNILKDQDVNLVQIAGPSSSGKTTLAYRLSVQLGVRGKKPILISTDNYFVDRDKTPLDSEGQPDYEALHAIDLDLFNRDLMSLIEGKPVRLPIFDFISGKRGFDSKETILDENSIIIIEGLHCLNPELTRMVPEKNKYKVYISALTPLNLDNHNRISSSMVRLLRRMIRDYRFRGNSMEKTLSSWEKVRAGEEIYIFPYQDLADITLDSSLIYELAVIKKYAYELFDKYEVSPEHKKTVKELKAFLKYFKDIDEEKYVPINSILREMIGWE
ncbi:nucleoside kinase [Lagierella sp.]|uniref:nucleoside kinase n=1 Tax=Lagierella sp. TaxID=2849657 RepID=UPI00261012CF|nr:nucleoside kinase [Lagierella sp.]